MHNRAYLTVETDLLVNHAVVEERLSELKSPLLRNDPDI